MSRLHWNFILVCLGSMILFAIASSARAQEVRTWSDASGQFELKAKLVSHTGDKVKLADTDGNEFEIELSKLSKADQDYVKNLKSTNPFKKVDANPFKSTTPAAGDNRDLKTRSMTPNWTKSTPIVLQPDSSEWTFEPPAPLADFTPNSVSLPEKSDFFEGLKSLVVNPHANVAVLGFTLNRPGRNSEASTRLLVCDLEAGRIREEATQPGELVPLCVHDDGQRVLMRSNDFGFGKHDRLEIWSVSGGSISHGLSWIPYENESGGNRDVNWAAFLPGERLLTSNGKGRVALWDLEQEAVVCHLDLGAGCRPALSSDRTTLAFTTNDKVGLWDIESQKVIALQPTPEKLNNAKLAFTPDNKLLGCVSGNNILVLDAKTGEIQSNFSVAGISIDGPLSFPEEGYLLANNKYLIDTRNQLKLWEYGGVGAAAEAGGSTFFGVVSHNASGVLWAAKVPHPAARTMLVKAVNEPDLFVFKKGTAVKLDVSGVPASNQNQVQQQLTSKLQSMGCSVSDKGTITLKASASGPEKDHVTYHGFGGGTYDVKRYSTKLEFNYQGKTAWSSGGTNIPFIISIPRGETIESELKKRSKGPDYSFFANVHLPEMLQNPGDGARGGQTLGRSDVTTSGL